MWGWGGCDCSCDCCANITEIELLTWTGSRTLSGDDFHLSQYAAWRNASLPQAGLIWYVKVKSTGTFPNGYIFQLLTNLASGNITAPQEITVTNTGATQPLQLGIVRNGWAASMQGYDPTRGKTVRSVTDFPLVMGDITVSSTTCPLSLTITEDPLSVFGSVVGSLEYALCVRCVCCESSHVDEWWGHYERGLGDYLLSQHDMLHADVPVCIDGVSTSVNASCEPTVAVFSGGSRSEPIEVPTVNLPRLRLIYGENNVSYWGPWSQLATNETLDRAKMIWIGAGHAITNGAGAPPITSPDVTKLVDWLDIGHRVLVIDGARTDVEQLLLDLGLTTTIDNSQPIEFQPLIYGAELVCLTNVCTDHPAGFLRVAAEPHEFTTGCTTVMNMEYTLTSTPSGDCIYRIHRVFMKPLSVPSADILGRLKGTITVTNACTPPCDLLCTNRELDYPVIASEDWPGNPTSRIIISQVYAYGTNSQNLLESSLGLSHVGDATFLANLLTYR